MPYKAEGSYFVNLDAPPAPSRNTPLGREQHWDDRATSTPVPAYKRRKRKFRIRPVWVLALAVVTWFGWAYTTPGGPSARIRQWIDHTRGDIAEASVNPDLRTNANYFDGLFAQEGSYPNLADSAVQATPGFGLSESLIWCGPNAIVLQSLSSGGSLSRLLLGGHDLGNVPNARGCPTNYSHPSPWKLPK